MYTDSPGRRERRRVRIGLAALAAVLQGCAESTGPHPPSTLPRPLTAAEERVVRGSNRFAFDLLREALREEPGGNVFLSPLSASMALGMTMNGARGGTFEAMRGVLAFDGLSQPEINASYRSLIDLLRSLDPKVRISVANAVWYRQGLPVEPAFVDATRASFDARVQPLDFRDPASVRTVNAWVKQNTQGRIDSILERIDPNDVMYLINAVYSRGEWTTAFDASGTYDAPFHDASGARRLGTVRMMRRPGPVGLYRGPNYQALDLAYGAGAFSMTVLLPDPGVEVDRVAASLTPERWAELTRGLESLEVPVRLPRFRLEYEKHLNDALAALGMGIAFSGRADFTGISRAGGLSISDVLHKTVVSVDEEGTEAASVTKVAMQLSSAARDVVVDRPFLFAIRERSSGTLLFVGRVRLPPPN